jgi:hypothetical protein
VTALDNWLLQRMCSVLNSTSHFSTSLYISVPKISTLAKIWDLQWLYVFSVMLQWLSQYPNPSVLKHGTTVSTSWIISCASEKPLWNVPHLPAVRVELVSLCPQLSLLIDRACLKTRKSLNYYFVYHQVSDIIGITGFIFKKKTSSWNQGLTLKGS